MHQKLKFCKNSQITLWPDLLSDFQDGHYIQLFSQSRISLQKKERIIVSGNITVIEYKHTIAFHLFTLSMVVEPVITKPQLLHKLSTGSA
jgi:hypothetical protein